MFKITVEATTDSDREKIDLLLQHLCYGLTEDSAIKLSTQGWKWNGSSGGDDAYFELVDRPVKVIKKK